MVDTKIKTGIFWKALERFGVQGVQFILQIVLARILDPAHYGVLSLMIIFVTLANVFIQSGFNTSLIQNKDVTEEDYSSVFWVTLIIAVTLYVLLFLGAPVIADFYDMPEIVVPFRVLALMLFPGAINSVQLAKVNRDMDFKKVFLSNIGAIVISGAAGIIIAVMGGGLWALVIQTLLNVVVACMVMRFTVSWKIRFVCNFQRIKVLFAFGWKLLISRLMDTFYQDLRSLVIGKKYNESTLGYYNRGKQFPQFIITAVDSTVQSVMLPALSKEQDDTITVKTITRQSMIASSYILFPIMAGLAAVATPLISLLLTDKWLPAVPYMQIYCFSLAFRPVHTCNLQAINAMGRSDVFLKLEILKKIYGIALLVIAVVFFDSPIAIAVTGIFSTIISCFVNASPNKKLIGYSYFEQMKDVLPSLLAASVMFLAVWFVGNLSISLIPLLFIQVTLGVVIYIALSVLFSLNGYKFFLAFAKSLLKNKN